MDIIHGLSNLEIEATHSSSSQEEEEEEVKRNWVDLPTDVMSQIFLKLGPMNILASAQWVCTSWCKLSEQPHLFRSIHVEKFRHLFVFPFGGHRVLLGNLKLREMAKEAIDRSCGQLVEFSVRDIANDDELLHYMSDRSSSLRCLRLVIDADHVTDDGLIEIAKKLPELQELQIIQGSCFTKDVFESFGRFCPQLKLCWIIDPGNRSTVFQLYGVALAIAENMPELHHLNLFGTALTDDDLRAILGGCPHLEFLDLRQCFDLEFRGDLKKRCGNIKTLKLPHDPTDDFEYVYESYDSADDYPCYADNPFPDYPMSDSEYEYESYYDPPY